MRAKLQVVQITPRRGTPRRGTHSNPTTSVLGYLGTWLWCKINTLLLYFGKIRRFSLETKWPVVHNGWSEAKGALT